MDRQQPNHPCALHTTGLVQAIAFVRSRRLCESARAVNSRDESGDIQRKKSVDVSVGRVLRAILCWPVTQSNEDDDPQGRWVGAWYAPYVKCEHMIGWVRRAVCAVTQQAWHPCWGSANNASHLHG